MTIDRKHWLDNIRWCTVLLVLVYHVFYIYNGVGILGNIPGSAGHPIPDTFCSIIYPWFMVLLFVIAGMSSRYALQNRTKKAFIKARAQKLLIPSTLGLFVIHWVTGYLNIRLGGGLDYIPGFLVYPISVLSGTGPLWFIQMLFLFSCIALLFPQKELPCLGHTGNLLILAGLYFVIWGSSQVLNMPVITTYRFGIYFAAFAAGFFILSQDSVLDKIHWMRLPLLVLAVALGVLYTIRFYGSNFTNDTCLKHWLTNLYLWTATLSILAWGQELGNIQNRFSRYMTRNSFCFYILHYPALMVCAYCLHVFPPLSQGIKYVIAFLGMVVLTWVLTEVLQRIPLIRYLVLGQKKGKKP